MPVSSNCLFHFTNDFEVLKSILKKGFIVSYCKEANFAIPMLSFCDIPLSQAKYHLDNYGDYVIGMKLEWAIKNKFNPVLYVEANSHLKEDYKKTVRGIKNMDLDKIKLEEMVNYNDATSLYDSVSRLMKPFAGTLKRGDIIKENYKFYDEREWRYIPQNHPNIKNKPLSFKEYEEFKKKNPKPHFPDYPIIFDSNDIKYLIVKNDKNIIELINYLMTLSNLGSPQDIQILTSKILSSAQIKDDL